MFKQLLTSIIAITAFIAIIVNINGCSNTVTPTQGNNLDFSYISSTDTTDHAGNLILDTVKLLLKDIKLNVASSNDSDNFKTGPFVSYVNLSNPAILQTVGSAYIPPGTYDKIKFEVHKLNTNEAIPDPEFIDANNSYSVIAKGTFNGVRFIYKSDKSAKQQVSFPHPLVVTATTSNVTLRIQPYIWFIDESTNMYLDPTNPANHNTIDNNIKENIKGNFKAFKDNDKDGIEDPD